MRITFVGLGSEQMAISLLSAIAKQEGHQVNLAFSASLFDDRSHFHFPRLAKFFDDQDSVIESIRKQQPDVLAFSALTANYQWMLGIALKAKKIFPHVKVVFGGVHTSAVPERVLAKPQVDFVCVGEGEVAFPEILRAIERGSLSEPISNTRYKSADGRVIRGPQIGFYQDLDALPIFDKPLWEEVMQMDQTYITMAARGCPYRCTFCFNNFFAKLPEGTKGKYVRQRSVPHMMYELRMAKKRYRLHNIEFFDDVFTVDKKWLKEFLDAYKKEIHIPFQCFTHVNFIDEDVARWMAEAGCISAQIGVQSMDDEFKRKNCKRYEKSERIERTIALMNKYKVRPKFDHMFGLPGEPVEAQETARKFYTTFTPYSIQTYWTNYFPGTEIFHQALEMGLINAQQADQLNEGLECNIYSNNNKMVDAHKIHVYKAYELTFKLIPNLPPWARKRLNPRLFKYIPLPVSSFLSLMIDIFVGLFKLSLDHYIYAKYYLFHMYRFLLRKCGLRPPWATRPQTAEFDLCVPQKINEQRTFVVK